MHLVAAASANHFAREYLAYKALSGDISCYVVAKIHNYDSTRLPGELLKLDTPCVQGLWETQQIERKMKTGLAV